MNVLSHLDDMEDARSDINKTYDLVDIIFLTMAAVLAGATGWKSIAMFGDTKLDWLRQFRPFPHGIPTRHSIGRIIAGIGSQALMDSFASWINQQREEANLPHIAFDGKTVKGSGKRSSVDALHLMGAMMADSGLMLYQAPCQNKKNEIHTLQSMLDCIPVKGAVISADAMHCQTATLSKVQEKGADCVLQVKDNQKCLKAEIAAYFHKLARDEPAYIDKHTLAGELDGEHGRIMQRRYCTVDASDWLSGMDKWGGIKTLTQVTRTRLDGEIPQTEISYYISTLAEPDKIAQVIRNHWRIESYHWILDTTFREDECLIFAEDGAKNIALFRRLLVNLIKAHPKKDSVAGKRQQAAWDDKLRAEILFGQHLSKV
jgi:predicted transposase YbfD/YdcC